LIPFAGFTVAGFTDMHFTIDTTGGSSANAAGGAAFLDAGDFATMAVDADGTANNTDTTLVYMTGVQALNFFAQCGFDTTCAGNDSNGNLWTTNLMPVTETSASSSSAFLTAFNAADGNEVNRSSAFEHMPMATFATFNTFAGNVMTVVTDAYGNATSTPYDTSDATHTYGIATTGGNLGYVYVGIPGTSATTRYVRDYPDAADQNFGARFRNTTSNGLNYSVNYFYGYDHNPSVNLSWHDASSGTELEVFRAATSNVGAIVTSGNSLDRSTIKANLTNGSTTSVLLRDGSTYYGAFNPTDSSVNSNTNGVELRFTETVERSHNLGGSFDYTIDTETLGGVVLRGEFLYQKDVNSPTVDNLLLGIGDLSNALTMRKSDMFKYVVGADTTVLTDMMLSGQFIQFRNLDYIDTNESCTQKIGFSPLTFDPTDSSTYYEKTMDCSIYSADMPTMNPTNGLQKADKNKNFYSLFLSKPFGDSGEGRWNNIFIYEEGGGKWNRFDVEYGFDDQLIGTFEVNKYFGDENTMFGQFENASNVQIGVKYLLQ
jgi:hypothetical protein